LRASCGRPVTSLTEARHLSARGGRLLPVDPLPGARDVLARTRAAQYLAVVEAAY
jgi:hypothetical protein